MNGIWWFLAYAWANFVSTSLRGRSILLPTTVVCVCVGEECEGTIVWCGDIDVKHAMRIILENHVET